MGLFYGIQAAFSGGEFTPNLYGRVDLSKYLTGLKTARNVNILPQGGVRNRPGTKYVATAGDSAHPVRVVPFVFSDGQTFILEFGHHYIRFYTQDAQILSGGNPYQVTTTYDGADLFLLKFAQSADVLYIDHPSYAPAQLTRVTNSSWTLTAYNFINGPFMLQNTIKTKTLLATAAAWVTSTAYQVGQCVSFGNVAAADLIEDFSSGNINAWTVSQVGIGSYTVAASRLTINGNGVSGKSPSIYKSYGNCYGSYACQMGVGTVGSGGDARFWFGMSSSATDANGNPTGNGYFIDLYSGGAILVLYKANAGSYTPLFQINSLSVGDHFVCVFRNAANLFTIYVDGTSVGTVTDATYVAGAFVFLQSATYAASFANIYYKSSTAAAADTTLFVNYICLIAHTSGTFATDLGNGDWAITPLINGPGVSIKSTEAQFVAGHVGALFQMKWSVIAQTFSDAGFTANTHISASIQCGSTYRVLTLGSWDGKILVQISVDNGATWETIRTLQSTGTENYDTSGDTGVSQCLLRVAADTSVAWVGTLKLDLTSSSCDWIGNVLITALTNAYTVVGTVQSQIDVGVGLKTIATYQWSEGSWSTYRGFPSAVEFFLDRLCHAATPTEPQTVWMSQTAKYNDFGVSSPLVDSDSISVVLASRAVNIIRHLKVLSNNLLAMTSDTDFSVGPGSSGVLSPTSVEQISHGHRGASTVGPVTIGNELLIVQPLSSAVRNLIFQLAVQGYMGDDISLISKHLFTGYTIIEMAYAQEPDSIVWAVRSDGVMLSLTYIRDQEVRAWSHHDTAGLFESVATIPNTTLGINEVWVVVNRSGTRFIERLAPRDASVAPADQYFVDCGLSYSGAPATVFSGLTHLNGKTVAILADGNVLPQQVVAGGQITILNAASKVHVGLPYVSDVATLRIEAPNQQGTLQGRRVALPKATVRFLNSRGGWLGVDAPSSLTATTGLNEILQKDIEDDLSAPPPLKSRDYLENLPGGFDFGAHLFFRQVDPLPFCVLAFMPQIVAGSN